MHPYKALWKSISGSKEEENIARVSRSLTFVSIEKGNVYAKYVIFISYGSKVVVKDKVDDRSKTT